MEKGGNNKGVIKNVYSKTFEESSGFNRLKHNAENHNRYQIILVFLTA